MKSYENYSPMELAIIKAQYLDELHSGKATPEREAELRSRISAIKEAQIGNKPTDKTDEKGSAE